MPYLEELNEHFIVSYIKINLSSLIYIYFCKYWLFDWHIVLQPFDNRNVFKYGNVAWVISPPSDFRITRILYIRKPFVFGIAFAAVRREQQLDSAARGKSYLC